jgi:hypothetical protein
MIVAVMLVGLSASANARGVVLLGDYKAVQNENERKTLKIYLSGVIDGISALQAEERSHGKQTSFCIPQNMTLTVEQAEDIMMRRATPGGPDDIPIATYLVAGLKDTFPCQH